MMFNPVSSNLCSSSSVSSWLVAASRSALAVAKSMTVALEVEADADEDVLASLDCRLFPFDEVLP
jgi:hypothetical protein